MKLDDIEKLIAEADPGPWEFLSNHIFLNNHIFALFDDKRRVLIADTYVLANNRGESNAEFIAASRQLMPKLLKVVEAAKSWLAVADTYSQRRLSADRPIYKLDYMQGREIFRKALAELEQP